MLTEEMVSDPIGRCTMDAPSDATMGSPLLVPFDGSAHAECVLPYLALLADGDREVILLQVVPEAQSVSSPMGDIMLSANELRHATETVAHSDLDRAAAKVASIAPSLRIEQLVETGDPSQRISEVAIRRNARGIMLSSQGTSATGSGGFGTVVGRVVSIAPVPVMVVRPNGTASDPDLVARVVVAHDGSDHAARALPLAQDLARRLSAPIHLITVVEDEESPLSASVAAVIDPHLRDEAQADALNVARRRVEGAGAQLLRQGLPASWQVLTGPAAEAIIAACVHRDVLVITSHGQSNSHWVLGGVADKLLRESRVPVILLRTSSAAEGTAP
jgi:nucleotide-binding universal stress UspA family protein